VRRRLRAPSSPCAVVSVRRRLRAPSSPCAVVSVRPFPSLHHGFRPTAPLSFPKTQPNPEVRNGVGMFIWQIGYNELAEIRRNLFRLFFWC
jgi:hypothetical protein